MLLVVHSPSRSPESTTYAEDVAGVVEQYDGRFLAALVDLDANPQIGQALQVTQVPLLLVLLDGRPATQPIPGALSPDEVSTLLQQLGQQLTTQGVTGRHQPRSAAAAPDDEDAGPQADPRYAAAQDALARDDVDGAVAEYQKLVDANPADSEAAAGLAMAKVLQRTQGVDAQAARDAAAAAPDDVDAQTLAADVDWSAVRSRTRSPGSSSWCAAPPTPTARGPASTCSGCSPPSATTTLACSRAARASPPRCSEPVTGSARGVVPGAGLRLREVAPELLLLGALPALIVFLVLAGSYVARVLFAGTSSLGHAVR